MGLTRSSTGHGATANGYVEAGRLIALAGNPNVGKSTLFNALTGLHQHTGNWPGKTVGSAYGFMELDGSTLVLADTPGTYSLSARSGDEAAARDALLYGDAHTIVAVCDATNLRRSLILALQLREIAPRIVVCINLCDEAKKKGIAIDIEKLEQLLRLPVVAISAGRGEGIGTLKSALSQMQPRAPVPICCGCEVEDAIRPLVEYFAAYSPPFPEHWLAMRVCEGEPDMIRSLEKGTGMDTHDSELSDLVQECRKRLAQASGAAGSLSDLYVGRLNELADEICGKAVSFSPGNHERGRRVDAILTHPVWGWPAMLLLLAFVLWLTISGANYPSELLSRLLLSLVGAFSGMLSRLGAPMWLTSLLCDGALGTCAWVVSVMLPPMAIFFPLFTLLEDLGYLPRAAFNLDGVFKRCGACGKQALTMCMGFGCNAAGVVGCRIIDSPRERMVAVLTNGFVPCNGRFPTMIAIIGIFLSGSHSLSGAAILTGFVLLGILMTFISSKLLTKTLLRGESSSFTLELPPFRRPRPGEIIVRSIMDRTLFVLSRAIKAAAPAGAVIWLMGNLSFGGTTPLKLICAALEGPAALIGLDGAILLAFILGLPANEIVIPAILMCYLSSGSLSGYESLSELREILLANGWTVSKALCMLLFTLMHWPCATTLMTIKKETGSRLYPLLAALLPTCFGIALCAVVSTVSRLFGA